VSAVIVHEDAEVALLAEWLVDFADKQTQKGKMK
jgi:hypothetical protein